MQQLGIEDATTEQLEKGGLKLQEQSKAAVNRMQKKLGQAEELANATAIEITKQNEQIMRIDTKLNNIDNAGARTMKYIRYFGKEI